MDLLTLLFSNYFTFNIAAGSNPLSQFSVEKIFDLSIAGIDISFTNSALYMVLATLFVVIFMTLATSKKSLFPNRFQIIAESIYNFVLNIVQTVIGDEGTKFFSLIFTLFTFILMCNLLGMTPYSFTATSQIIITLSLALLSFAVITIFAIYRNGFIGFLKCLSLVVFHYGLRHLFLLLSFFLS